MTALIPGLDVPRPPAPIKLFDDLAMPSTGWVSAMAVLPDDGIVLIDALTSSAEAENVLVPGLRELGPIRRRSGTSSSPTATTTMSGERGISPTATEHGC
ncbi:hypothetical protein [Streptomyces sp. NPDC014995]|uniref:hypothetical protein n=1 Tax=Streptomyces sp. NPDC014995 TaxID=3364936 RepID=UPI003701E856